MVQGKNEHPLREVYFYTYVPKIHSLYYELLRYPPKGYKYIYEKKITAPLYKVNDFRLLNLAYRKLVKPFINTVVLKDFLYKRLALPKNTSLIHSGGFLVRKKFPWVVDLEHVTSFVGYDLGMFDRRKKKIENLLSSKYCKRILPWTEACKRTITENLNSEGFVDKIDVVPLAVHPRTFRKKFNKAKVKILFVGSANFPQHYYSKGAHIVFEAFKKIMGEYENVELIARTFAPVKIKKEMERLGNVRIYDYILKREELDRLFKESDIFIFPGHQTPGMVLIEAMSYELPIIATDVWATPELVEDGKNGFLIKKSSRVPYYIRGFIPNTESEEFRTAIKRIDNNVVEELVEKLRVLIDNPSLRRKMGRYGRALVEEGRFSIKHRNKQLKRIYDEAIGE